MKLKTIVFGFLLILAIGVVAARPWPAFSNSGSYALSEELQELFENGDYQDLVALREDTGMVLVPWIDSQEDFELFLERQHYREQYWYGPMYQNMYRYDRYQTGYGPGSGGCFMYR